MSLSYDEARARGHWLLDLVVGGIEYRYATSPVTVTDDNGASYRYDEGLSDLALPLVQDGGAELTVGIEISSDEDWALLEARGYPIERARGVLRRWHEGQTLERARVYCRGLALAVSHGERGEPMSLTLTRDPGLEADVLPDPQQVVTETNWPVRGSYTTASSVIGQAYPIIVGQPGYRQVDAGSGAGPYAAVPVLMVEYLAATATSRLLISAGRCSATIAAGKVRIHNATSGTNANSGTVGVTTDGNGRQVTYAEFAIGGPGGGLGSDSDSYFIGLGDQANGDWGGGIDNPFDNGALRGAGDVLMWALGTRSSIPIDRGLMATYQDALNAYKVDSYVNTPTSVWSWVESAVLSMLPVVVREGPDGLYFLPIRFDSGADDVVAYLSADRHEIERSSSVARLAQDVVNEVTVRYGPLRESGKYAGTYTITAQAGKLSAAVTSDGDDTTILGSYLARLSQARYGVRPRTIDLAHTWDPATALRVAQDQIERFAWPKRTVSYTSDRELAAIEPGSLVAITDSALHLTDALARVYDVAISGEGVSLDLVLLDHPLTTTVSTT